MKALRDIFVGLLTALISSLMVIGAVSLALAEDRLSPAATSPANVIPKIVFTVSALTPTGFTAEIGTPAILLTDTSQPTLTPACSAPPHWISYTIKPGDTLASIARDKGISADQLKAKNCLDSDILPSGYDIYIPPPKQPFTPTVTPIPTNTIRACGPPAGWVTYIVRSGQTLTQISQIFNISVRDLLRANCLTNPNLIYSGQRLYVPNVPPRLPTATPIPSNTPPPTIKPPTRKPPTRVPTTAVPPNTPVPNTPVPDTPLPPTVNPSPVSNTTPVVPEPTPVTPESSPVSSSPPPATQ